MSLKIHSNMKSRNGLWRKSVKNEEPPENVGWAVLLENGEVIVKVLGENESEPTIIWLESISTESKSRSCERWVTVTYQPVWLH